MFKFEKSVLIDRPQQEVFDFVMNLENDPKWQASIVSVKRTSDGPIGAGSTFRYETKFLGRKSETEIQLTGYNPPSGASVKAINGPVPFENTYKFESNGNGTKMTFSGQAEIGGFFKMAEGLAAKQMEKQMEADATALKKLLEAD
jgi:uncharacterized membrane protein